MKRRADMSTEERPAAASSDMQTPIGAISLAAPYLDMLLAQSVPK